MGWSIGSTWLRWDPHLHAPGALKENHYGSHDDATVWDRYFATIRDAQPQCAAIGITDYFVPRGYRLFVERGGRDQLPGLYVFAVSLAEEKVKTGEIKSAQGKQKWASVIEHHLLPAFGDLYVDVIRHTDVMAWRSKLGDRIASGEYSPRTVNTWRSILRVIMKRAVADFELERDPMSLVRDFDISTSHTYTEEEPNSLTADEVASFLATMKRIYPRHFAFVALGLATGLRPSSLRPLRRAGATPDFIPSEGVLYIRRSRTVGDTVMEKTKTARRQRIVLPPELVALLEAHVASMNDAERESELLFPPITGGLRARSCLDKPFRAVAKEIKLKKTVTPRAMRRSFNDLARAAEVRAISGHVTDTMQQHYSTVSGLEVCDGIAKVVSLARFKEVLGGKLGGKTTKTKKAGRGAGAFSRAGDGI